MFQSMYFLEVLDVMFFQISAGRGSFCFVNSVAAQGPKGSSLKNVHEHTEGRDGTKSDHSARTFLKDAPYLCVPFSFCHTFLNTFSGLDNFEFKVHMH